MREKKMEGKGPNSSMAFHLLSEEDVVDRRAMVLAGVLVTGLINVLTEALLLH
jgi:hypothetical protein